VAGAIIHAFTLSLRAWSRDLQPVVHTHSTHPKFLYV
jgi:hypothetical protein